MKILHTADWHIGRQFHGVSLLEDQRHVLGQIIDLIQQEKVEAVIIAGDVYDRSVPPAEAVDLLDETLHTLVHDLGVPVIVIAGNHDGGVRLGFGSRQLKQAGLHITGPLSDTIIPMELKDAHGSIFVYTIPYIDPATVRDVFDNDVQNFDEAMIFITDQIKSYHSREHPKCRSILVSHCFLAGGEPSDSERPLSVGGADQVSIDQFLEFNYTALGHLHQPQYKGAEHIRYSGSLLKYSFSEVEKQKSVTLIEMNAEGDCNINEVALNPIRDTRVIEGKLKTILKEGKKDSGNQDYLLVRLLDEHAILDPMGKLRSVYPNTLHLDKPNLTIRADGESLEYDALKMNRLQLFEDFYRQMVDEGLNKKQRTYITALIDETEKNNDGATS